MNRAALQSVKFSGLAAGSVMLPSLLPQSFPALFSRIAPYTQNTLPYCTGVCGSCGGSCLGSMGILLFLMLTALKKKKTLDL